MADLYGTSSSPANEPEEMSNVLHQLLHASSSSKFMHPALGSISSAAEFLDFRRLGKSESECPAACENSSVNFSYPGGYLSKESRGNAVSAKRIGVLVENDLGNDSYGREKGAVASEAPSEMVRPRTSSKRSRAAAVHNISEKRRRCRINEKMKALQNLIPNSNKTDKASMLDEAIDYLKQLQLQVQMLTIRNGLSLHPMSLQVLQPTQLPLTGMSFDEGTAFLNTNTGTGVFATNEESSGQNALNLPNQPTISHQAEIVIPSGTNIASSETSFGFEPLFQVHHAPSNLSTSSKEICRDGVPQAQLDTNLSAQTSSSSLSCL